MSSEFNENNYSLKMSKTIQSFKKDISTLRTGRANASMLDLIKVDVYGQQMPINQIGSITTPEPPPPPPAVVPIPLFANTH